MSHVERYLDCPFKDFSSHVLGLDEERDEDAGLSPRERGQFLHEVFQQFFVAWETAGHRSITSETLDQALTLFETVVETRLEQLSDADRALERNYLLGSAAASGLAERAFAFEIEQGAGVVERLLEHTLEGQFTLTGPDDTPVRVRIRGKADRIDLSGRRDPPGRRLQAGTRPETGAGAAAAGLRRVRVATTRRGGTAARGRCRAPAIWLSKRRTPSCRWAVAPVRLVRPSRMGRSGWSQR